MSLGVILAILLASVVLGGGLLGWLTGLYNTLVEVRNDVENTWKNIDVLLLQRHDELKKLIDVVKAYAKHETELHTALVKLRVGYTKTDDMDERIEIENKINQLVPRVGQPRESYPDLKASDSFLRLQERISGLESEIADKREAFNDSVNTHNVAIESFPTNLLARPLGYKRHAFLDLPAKKLADPGAKL